MKKIVMLITIALILISCVFFATADEQYSPQNLAIGTNNGKLDIGKNVTNGNYVTLTWDQPQGWTADTGTKLYLTKDGGTYTEYLTQPDNTQTSITLQNLEPGTVYRGYLKSYHKHYDGNGQVTATDYSQQSNELVFMTNMEISATPQDGGNVDIQWSNVMFKSALIKYDLYISESKNFAFTQSLNIDESKIGPTKAVKQIGNKLSYVVKDLKAGTVYYIKVVPVLDNQVVRNLESDIVSAYTKIFANLIQVSKDWWKITWNAITNTDLSGGSQITYEIRRSENEELEKIIAVTTDTQLYVKVQKTGTFFLVKVTYKTSTGDTFEIYSDKLFANKASLMTTPQMPQVVDYLTVDALTKEEKVVTPNNIKIVWQAPYLDNQKIDEPLLYDIYIEKDLQKLQDPNLSPIQKDYVVPEADIIYEMISGQKVNKIIGYRYTFKTLDPNTIYYVKLVAKREVQIIQDGSTATKILSSEPCIKTYITTVDAPINIPVAPAKPPFKIKTKGTQNAYDIGTDYTTIEWKNRWYEVWKADRNEWQYIDDQTKNQNTVGQYVYLDGIGYPFREITYDKDIKFSVGYEVYSANYDFTKIYDIQDPVPMKITGIPNNTKGETIEYKIDKLEPNTTYMIWLKAYRDINNSSQASSLVLVTTKPKLVPEDEIPPVPIVNYSLKMDNYITLGWPTKDKYTYKLRYSKMENMESATEISITPDKLIEGNKFRISSLDTDTVYYFWICAQYQGTKGMISSDWSNAFIAKTQKPIAPDSPLGFGVKNSPDAIGKDYITYEWTANQGSEYVLEISRYSDFKDSTVLNGLAGSDKKVEKLLSNNRYYARLYTYDKAKNVKSGSTTVVVCTTLKSENDYDSDVDNLNIIIPEVIKPNKVIDKTWISEITGDNAKIFIEQMYKNNADQYVVDYTKDKPSNVSTYALNVDGNVLQSLGSINKSITAKLDKVDIILTPGSILTKDKIELKFTKLSSTQSGIKSYQSIASDIWDVQFRVAGQTEYSNLKFTKPLTIAYDYTDKNFYDKQTTNGYNYNKTSEIWEKVDTIANYDYTKNKGIIQYNLNYPTKFAIIREGSDRFYDISQSNCQSYLYRIISKYNPKSIGLGYFNPTNSLYAEDGVKLILDTLGYDYGDNYMDVAKKGGLLLYDKDKAKALTREEFCYMVGRAYELMVGTKSQNKQTITKYSDYTTINPQMLNILGFLVDNNIIGAKVGTQIKPKDTISREEAIIILGRMLEKYGLL